MKTKKIILFILLVLFILPNFALAQWNINNISGYNLPGGTIYKIIYNALLWLLAILGFLGIIGFIISGIMYLVSAGDDDTIKKAKKAMTASITGVIVGLAGVVAIQAIHYALSANTSYF